MATRLILPEELLTHRRAGLKRLPPDIKQHRTAFERYSGRSVSPSGTGAHSPNRTLAVLVSSLGKETVRRDFSVRTRPISVSPTAWPFPRALMYLCPRLHS